MMVRLVAPSNWIFGFFTCFPRSKSNDHLGKSPIIDR